MFGKEHKNSIIDIDKVVDGVKEALTEKSSSNEEYPEMSISEVKKLLTSEKGDMGLYKIKKRTLSNMRIIIDGSYVGIKFEDCRLINIIFESSVYQKKSVLWTKNGLPYGILFFNTNVKNIDFVNFSKPVININCINTNITNLISTKSAFNSWICEDSSLKKVSFDRSLFGEGTIFKNTAIFNTSFRGTIFKMGVNFDLSTFSGNINFDDVVFSEDASFKHCFYYETKNALFKMNNALCKRQLSMNGSLMQKLFCDNSTFQYADLRGCAFLHGSFKNTDFSKSSVQGASFEGVNVSGMDLSNSHLSGASFKDALGYEFVIFTNLDTMFNSIDILSLSREKFINDLGKISYVSFISRKKTE